MADGRRSSLRAHRYIGWIRIPFLHGRGDRFVARADSPVVIKPRIDDRSSIIASPDPSIRPYSMRTRSILRLD